MLDVFLEIDLDTWSLLALPGRVEVVATVSKHGFPFFMSHNVN